jgi:tetratricopeptide (TPR) repeat protein
MVLRRLGHYEEALACYDEALALGPGTADLHHSRGVVLLHLDRPGEALAAFEQASAQKEGNAALCYSTAIAHARLGDAVESLHWLRRAGAVDPGVLDPATRNPALRELRRRDPEFAADLDALLHDDPPAADR